MTSTRYYIIISSILFLCSCGHENVFLSNKQIFFYDNGDTDRVTYEFSSGHKREIVFYKSNFPDSNIAFSVAGDTITYPTLINSRNNDTSYVYIPIKKYRNATLLLYSLDSTLHFLKDTFFFGQVENGNLIPIGGYLGIKQDKAMGVTMTCKNEKENKGHSYVSFYRWD